MQHPRVTAMVLCHVAHQDVASKLFTIREIFTTFAFPPKPGLRLPQCFLYVAIEPAAERGTLSLHIEMGNGGAAGLPLWQCPPFKFESPQFVYRLTGIEIPVPAQYCVIVKHEGVALSWIRLFDAESPPPSK